MRLAYGEGIILAVLAPFVVFLFTKITLFETLFSVFALVGLWTLISAFVLMGERARIYYLTWGLIILSISSAFITHIQYAIGFVLIAIIAALLINVSTRKNMPSQKNIPYTQGNPQS